MAPATLNNAELFCYFLFSAEMFILGLLRLAGDLRRHRRRDHRRCVRIAIWNPSIPSPRAAVAGAAGDKPGKPLGILSDEGALC